MNASVAFKAALHSFSVRKCGETCRSLFGPLATNCHHAEAGVSERNETSFPAAQGPKGTSCQPYLQKPTLVARRLEGQPIPSQAPSIAGSAWSVRNHRKRIAWSLSPAGGTHYAAIDRKAISEARSMSYSLNASRGVPNSFFREIMNFLSEPDAQSLNQGAC